MAMKQISQFMKAVKKMVRVGIVGIGNMGSAHAACISSRKIQGMTLAAVCDIKPERLHLCEDRYPSVPRFSQYSEMLTSGLIDALIISVPHRLHAKIALEALEAGLHVLTEKPEDVSVSAARRLNEAAAKSDRVFGIMFNQRTNPLFRKAKEIVESGQLGELKRSVWIVTNWYRTQYYYDSGSWRATWAGEGGGVLLNQAPHNLDLWQWICGMPASVTAFCDVAKYHNIEVEDDVTIHVRYPNGATGAFITSTGEYPGTNRLEISGDLGKLVLENGTMRWWKLSAPERTFCYTLQESSANVNMEVIDVLPEGEETAHAGILQNFTNCILHGEPLIAPGTDGVRELTISNAAYLSQWKSNVPVSLPFDEAEFDALLTERAASSISRDTSGQSHASTSYSDRWQVRW